MPLSITHSFSQSGKLFSLCPAEDIEAVDEGREEENVRDDKRGKDVALTAHMIEHLAIGTVGGSNMNLKEREGGKKREGERGRVGEWGDRGKREREKRERERERERGGREGE